MSPGRPKAVSWPTRSRPPCLYWGDGLPRAGIVNSEPQMRAGVKLDIKSGRHYAASQLLVGGFDLRNTAQG